MEVLRAASPRTRTLEKILADTADGAFVVDQGAHIIFWNRAAERLLGRCAQEVVGLTCWEAFAGSNYNGGRLCGQGCEALRVGNGEGDVYRLEMETRTKAGQAVWLDITALETPTSSGEPVVVHLFRDVTPTIRALELIPRKAAAASGRAGLLSAREIQILGMMAAGANTRTMAARLRVSPATIRNHVQSILGKLEVHSRLEAVAWMHRHGPGPGDGSGCAGRGAQHSFRSAR
jgi:PAS domain S-box-containing protein